MINVLNFFNSLFSALIKIHRLIFYSSLVFELAQNTIKTKYIRNTYTKCYCALTVNE